MYVYDLSSYQISNGSNVSLVIAINLEAKYRSYAAIMLLFYILKRKKEKENSITTAHLLKSCCHT
jgi:hypothetical protein